MTGENRYYQDDEVWRQLNQIAEVTGQSPDEVALEILREGIKARMEAERFHMEAQLTALQARMATWDNPNGSPKAPVVPVEPSHPDISLYHYSVVRKAVKGVLGADRSRTFTMAEVIEQLGVLGYDTAGMYQQVNNCLRALVTDGEARRPARGQYTWRRRPNKR